MAGALSKPVPGDAKEYDDKNQLALDAGYTQEEIDEYLEGQTKTISTDEQPTQVENQPNNQQDNFIGTALDAGYTQEQIDEYLAGKEQPISTDEQPAQVENLNNGVAVDVNEFDNKELQKNSTETLQKVDNATDLASAYSNMHSRYSTLGKMAWGAAFDETQMTSAMHDIETLNNGLVNKLREKDINAFIDPDSGLLMMQDDNGQAHEIEPDIFDDILASKFEAGGAIAGAISGAKMGAKGGAALALAVGQMGPQVAVPEELVTVPIASAIGGIGGAVVGGLTGAFGGSGIDYIVDSFKLKDELDGKVALSKMVDAGVADATMTVLLGGAWKIAKPLGGKVIRTVGHAWKTMVNGNEKGALNILLKEQNISKEQATDIVNRWRTIGDEKTLGRVNALGVEKELTEKQTAIKVITETVPGGEVYLKETGESQQLLLHTVDKRAKNLHKALDNITDDNLGAKLRTSLQDYQLEVGKYYETTKNLAGSVIDRTDYRFDIGKLAVKPAMREAGKYIDDPFQVERFKNVMGRIDGMADTRTFSDLLDLRQSVNAIKAKTTKKIAQDSLKKSINSIDREIQRVTDEYLPKGQAKVWRKEFKSAKKEYAKMKQLESNYLYKLITRDNSKTAVNEKQVALALQKSGIGLNEAVSQLTERLPKEFKHKVDRAVLNILTNKHTYGESSELQAVDFPKLALELSEYGFKDKATLQTIKEVNVLADVFKNDKNLARFLGNNYTSNTVPSGIGDNLWSRFKVQSATRIYKMISQVFPTKDADRLALVRVVGDMMDNPLSVKATHKFTNKFAKEDKQKAKQFVTELQQAWAKAGMNTAEGKEALKLYKATSNKEVTRTSGGFGPGYYYKEALSNPRETRNVLRYDAQLSELASLEDISKLLGKDVTVDEVRRLKTLPKKLEKAGFKGIRNDGKVMLFNNPEK